MGSKMMMMMGLACCCCCCILLCSGGGAGAYALRDDLGLTDFFDDIVGTSTTSSDVTNAPGVTSAPGSLAAASKDSSPVVNNGVKDINGNPTHIEYGEQSGVTYIFTAVGANNTVGGDLGRYDEYSVLDSHKDEGPVWLERTQHAEKVLFMRNPTDPTGKTFYVLANNTHLANGKYGSNDDTCDFAGRYKYTRHTDKTRYAWSLVPDTVYATAYRLASARCSKKELLLFARMPTQSTLVPPGKGTRFIITAT